MKSVFLFSILFFFISTLARAECIDLDGTQLELSGVVLKETYPGPPNYESVAEGDREETYWFIFLQQTLCVNDADIKHVNKLQLVFDAGSNQTKSLVENEEYTISGLTFMGLTGHHRTPILLHVRGIYGT